MASRFTRNKIQGQRKERDHVRSPRYAESEYNADCQDKGEPQFVTQGRYSDAPGQFQRGALLVRNYGACDGLRSDTQTSERSGIEIKTRRHQRA
jgi:hypothetical protein